MGVKAFVDTNVLLRTFTPEMELHAQTATLLRRMWQEDAELWISGQVIREFIVQATHPKTLKEPLSIVEAIDEIRTITPLFQVADETAAVRAKLLELLQEHPTSGKKIHDANIVATLLVNNIDTLLTINLADFERFQEHVRTM